MQQAHASQGKFHAKEKEMSSKKVLDKRQGTRYNWFIKNGIGS